MGGVTRSAGEPDDEVMRARAYLSRVAEPCSIPLWHFVTEVGPVAAAAAVAGATAPDEVARATEARREGTDPAADLDAAARHGVRLVVPESPDWPHFAIGALDRAAERRWETYRAGARTHVDSGEPIPPLALWVRGGGELASLGIRSVGLVGSRAATGYGEHMAGDLAYGLAARGVVVVSGGAYGIDTAAHRGALAAEGSTVIVCAGGLDRVYPPGNARLFAQAEPAGLLIAESPPGAAPQRRRFLTRNRLIAAFATGTVVVEAARRSGARNTAGHCITLGRPLMAVPGPVTSPMSAGCHDLIRRDVDAAQLVSSVDEVFAVVGGIGEGEPDARGGAPADVRAELDRLDQTARHVFDALAARRWSRPDEIAERAAVAIPDVLRSLPELELADLVEAGDGGYRIAARLRAKPK